MESKTDTPYFVLPEGATQEEQHSWEAIEEMCAEGRLTPAARLFLPEEAAWVRAGDTALKKYFIQAEGNSDRRREKPTKDEREALKTEYQEVLKRLDSEADQVGTHVEAGRMAAELDDRETARDHFQAALDLRPYDTRVAQEIRRRYSKKECREFRNLEREAPVWENLSELAFFPVSRGAVYLAVPTALAFVLMLVPFGGFALGAAFYLWLVQIARRTAEGERRPPLWHRALANPVEELLLPLVAGTLLVLELLLAVYGVARLSIILNGETVSAVDYVRNSPVLVVLSTAVAVVYLPAGFVRAFRSAGKVLGLLDPVKNVKTAFRMEHEYLASVILLFALASVVGGLCLLLWGIPVLGKAVVATAGTYALVLAGRTLGRLAGRMRHLL